MKSAIDTSKSSAFYLFGLGALMLLSLALNSVPSLALSQHYEIQYRAQLTSACFLLGGAAGLVTIWRHNGHAAKPWKVPQSQVSLAYLIFFVSTLAGVVISR